MQGGVAFVVFLLLSPLLEAVVVVVVLAAFVLARVFELLSVDEPELVEETSNVEEFGKLQSRSSW